MYVVCKLFSKLPQSRFPISCLGATDSLKIAFDLLSRDKDYQQACSTLRSTIKLTKDRDQSIKLFLDGLDIVSKHASDTPQFMTEVKWLLANSYNNGVYYWRYESASIMNWKC